MELGSLKTDFHEILYLSVFRKSVMKIHVSLNLTRKPGNSHEHQYIFLIISLTSQNEKHFKVVKKTKTLISFSITNFENHAIYEIMWKNILEQGRLQYGACALRAGYLRLQIHA